MEELQKVIESICNNLAGINETLAARSRELDRRARFDDEIGNIINEIKSRYEKNRRRE